MSPGIFPPCLASSSSDVLKYQATWLCRITSHPGSPSSATDWPANSSGDHGPDDSVHRVLGLFRRRRTGPDVVPGEHHQIGCLVVQHRLHEPNGPGIDFVIILRIRELNDLEGSVGPEPEHRRSLPGNSRDLALRAPLLYHTT
jgi:hypothetical protein